MLRTSAFTVSAYMDLWWGPGRAGGGREGWMERWRGLERERGKEFQKRAAVFVQMSLNLGPRG